MAPVSIKEIALVQWAQVETLPDLIFTFQHIILVIKSSIRTLPIQGTENMSIREQALVISIHLNLLSISLQMAEPVM